MTGAWIEAFRAGKHTSAEGHVREYGNADLEVIATTYNGQTEHEAPLVYGHPEHDKPAHGWIKELKVMGDRLWAFAECNEDTRDAVAARSFKKVSIALYPSGLLRHIGLLGSMPPAVKGLMPVSFVDGEQTFDEYMWASDEYRVPTVGRILSELRDWMISKFTIEDADKALDKDSIALLQSSVTSNWIPDPPSTDFHEEEIEMEKTEMIAIMDDMKAKILEGVDLKLGAMETSFAEKVNAVTLTVTALAETANVATRDVVKDAFVAFCDGLITEGKVLPGEKDGLVLLYGELAELESTLTFAEGKVRPTDRMKEQLTARTVRVGPTKKIFASNPAVKASRPGTSFGEANVNEAHAELHTKAVTYAEINNVTYAEALTKVLAS